MHKRGTFLSLFLLFVCGVFAQKIVYIPTSFNRGGDVDYCNTFGQNGTVQSIDNLIDNNERWSKSRSYESDNIVCFWEKGFGTDATKLINPANATTTFNLTTIIKQAEKIYHYHLDSLHAANKAGVSINKYKFLIMLSYTTTWAAYGSGYDFTIGAIWMNPAALGVGNTTIYPYFTLAHELFHAMSYQNYCDRTDDTYRAFQDSFNGPFWERSANHAAWVLYPLTTTDFERYMYATQSHFLNTRKHYSPSFFLENLDAVYGKAKLGEIWQNNKTDEHVMNTVCRVLFNNDQSKLNDFVALTAMKNMTWDYRKNSNGVYMKTYQDAIAYDTDASTVYPSNIIQKKHRTILYAVDYDKRHFAVRDCQAPQDYGYNAIQIFPENRNSDGSATFSMHFKGHTEDTYKNAGWRWGFVAVQQDGSARYGEIYGSVDQVASFTINSTDAEIWLIVAGTPSAQTANHNYSWEAGFPKYYRYPYELRFQNAVPMGYNFDFEGSIIDGTPHSNGGGWVASTASVSESAYVGPHAKVLGTATVSENARIEDFAIVKGRAQVYGNAIIRENAMVFSTSKVYGNAIVSGSARCMNQTEVCDSAFVTDNAFLVFTKVYGHAIVCGNLWQKSAGNIGGTCIAGGDGETTGYTATGDVLAGPELSGTFLQYPDPYYNGRNRKDAKGNLSIGKLDSLRQNWNKLETRFRILNNSISSNTTNPNYDINKPYSYFSTDIDMALSDSHTGLDNLPLDKTIYLYPNPAMQYVNLMGLDNEAAFIQLFDMKGSLILEQTVAPNITIDLQKHEPGLYLLKIKTTSKTVFEKLIKQKY